MQFCDDSSRSPECATDFLTKICTSLRWALWFASYASAVQPFATPSFADPTKPPVKQSHAVQSTPVPE